MVKRGQISVEFFLVLSIMIAFILIIYTLAQDEINKQRDLNTVVLASSALDSMAFMTNFVYLSGPGSSVSKEVFIPSSTSENPSKASANCFYLNDPDVTGFPSPSSKDSFYCTVISDYVYTITDPDGPDPSVGPTTKPGKQKVLSPPLDFEASEGAAANSLPLFFGSTCAHPLGWRKNALGQVVFGQAVPGWFAINVTYVTESAFGNNNGLCGPLASDAGPCIRFDCTQLGLGA